jgi:hypothetical protein
MARFAINIGGNKTYAQQSHIALITWKSYDRDTLIQQGTFVPSQVIFNSLQTGTVWTADRTGYNFGAVLSRTALPEGRKTYRVPVNVILTGSGYSLNLVYDIKVGALTK